VAAVTPSSDPAPSFGYLPNVRELNRVLNRGRFARSLAIDTPIKMTYGVVDECRILWQPPVELPRGVYWFEDIDEGAIVVQVGGGAPPGGATITPLSELTNDHPLLAAWSRVEELWLQAAAVPPPLFDIDDNVVTHPSGIDAVIVGRQFLSGHWSYTVSVDGRRQETSESKLKPRPQLDDPQTWVTGAPAAASRFGATLTRAKLTGKFADTLFSFRATRTIFRPYQFKPVLKLLQTGKARLLIADEVGLGKTIEAGLIWTELEARQEADQVLVVCPSSLVAKWKEEMADRFGFDLIDLDGQGLRTFLQGHRQNRLPHRAAYVCSLQRLRSWDGLDELEDFPPEFDLVIVDEAHAMRNKGNKSYALGTELSDWADNLVFLTATPINLGHADLLNLLELLAPEDYGDLRDLQLRLEPNRIINAVTARLTEGSVDGHQLATELEKLSTTTFGSPITRRPDFLLLTELLRAGELTPRDVVEAKRLLANLNTLSTVITRTRKVEVDERKAKRQERPEPIEWTLAEKKFYDEYLLWCRQRAAEVNAPVYFAMQMPLRLASACLPMARRAVLDPIGFGRITDADSDDTADRLEPHHELIEAARRLPDGVDTKFDKLFGVLEQLHGERKRALVFTFSRPTLAYLSERLGEHFKVAVLHGGVHREQRLRIMADFRAGGYDFLLANRVASEGLDFEFCSAVINYDLPWNPMEIEQRIGRIDRIGQQEEIIWIVNFVNNYTIDERILELLLDRIKIFESSIGALEPIIADHVSQALQAGFDFSLSEKQKNQKIREAELAIEAQRVGLQELSDASGALLVSNDVDVAGLEQQLVSSGRYVGQRELALLIDDWARVEGAPGMEFAPDGRSVELRGNPAMAARVEKLTTSTTSVKRTRGEVGPIAAQLRSEVAIQLVLDQELARTGGRTLFSATSPLVMAATEMPDHHHARFASLQIAAAPDDVMPGTYVVVLAKAESGRRGGNEIWGAAVSITGRNAGEGPANAVLSALAQGRLEDCTQPEIDDISELAEQAVDQLNLRRSLEQVKRDKEFRALQETRRITLAEQHRRKVATIQKRIDTAASRGRHERTMSLFHSQMRRAQERFRRLVMELENNTELDIRLEPIAACVIEVTAAAADS
jgi:superfamily II DNA or RNA helicase